MFADNGAEEFVLQRELRSIMKMVSEELAVKGKRGSELEEAKRFLIKKNENLLPGWKFFIFWHFETFLLAKI